MKYLLFFFFILPLLGQAQSARPCETTASLNSQIVSIAQSRMGKKVDRGECWDLAKLALDQVGAKWDGLYVYGRLLDLKTDCIQPGDIIQFEKVSTHVEVSGGYYEESFYHHTAIINKVFGPGKVELIHQNFGETGRKVGTSTLDFATIKKGKIMVYRPEQN